MKIGFVKSIAALLVGASFAMAQSPTSAVEKMSPRGDLSYPATAGQQAPTPLAADHSADSFGGIDWTEDPIDPYRVYASADYLLWRVRRPTLPSLTTTQPVGIVTVPQTITNNIGIDQTVTTQLILVQFTLSNDPGFPTESVDLGDRNGTRFTAGFWFDSEMDCGIEASAFWTEKVAQQIHATTQNVTNQFILDTGVQNQVFVTSPGSPPVLSSTTNIAFPAQGTADVFVSFASELYGGEVNLRSGGYRLGGFTFGGLAGVRYVELKEKLFVRNLVMVSDTPDSTAGVDSGVLPASFKSNDRISTRNQFGGPQVGVNVGAQCNGFFFDANFKAAIGPDFQEVNSRGAAISMTPAGGTRTTVGGLLTGPDDQGSVHRTRVSVVPEVNLKLGCELAKCARMYVGYDGLYMQHFVRPGQQVSFTNTQTNLQVANSSTTIGVRQPIIQVRDQDVWVQGLNFGLEFRY